MRLTVWLRWSRPGAFILNWATQSWERAFVVTAEYHQSLLQALHQGKLCLVGQLQVKTFSSDSEAVSVVSSPGSHVASAFQFHSFDSADLANYSPEL